MHRRRRPGVVALASLLLGALSVLDLRPALAAPPARTAAHPFGVHVADASRRFGIPEQWIWNVMHVESRGNPRAVSRAGAMGLMQIMPATWAMLTARHRLGSDPFDIRSNIFAGAAYLRAMWDRYRDVSLMLAAYNAGPGRADAYAAGRRRLPAETVAYVARLAPAVGGPNAAARDAASAPASPSWRQASLFAVPRDVAGEGAGIAAAPSPVASHPLFIPLSGRGE